MTTSVIVDDVYICSIFDKSNGELSTRVVGSLEEIQCISKVNNLVVLSFANVIGKDIKIGKTHILNKLEISN